MTFRTARFVRLSLAFALAVPIALSLGGAAATDDTPLPPLLDPKKDAPGLKVGDRAPSVDLLAQDGTRVVTGDLYPTGPVIVTFYRGGWCPVCAKSLEGWEARVDEIKAAGARVVAISPETREHAKKTIQKTKAGKCLVLCDDQGEAMRRFRVAFEVQPETRKQYQSMGVDLGGWNGIGRWELPAPATFVIDKHGKVAYAFADWDYTKRAEPDRVIEAVKSLK